MIDLNCSRLRSDLENVLRGKILWTVESPEQEESDPSERNDQNSSLCPVRLVIMTAASGDTLWARNSWTCVTGFNYFGEARSRWSHHVANPPVHLHSQESWSKSKKLWPAPMSLPLEFAYAPCLTILSVLSQIELYPKSGLKKCLSHEPDKRPQHHKEARLSVTCQRYPLCKIQRNPGRWGSKLTTT